MRLNKYLARAGVGSRRTSDRLIQAGTTKVNGRLITDPAFDVNEKDVVEFDGQEVFINSQQIILMLNKPKGVITTVTDPQGRKTVMDLIPINERLFPIGRLDKNTTGLLLLTNNGELANLLMHPRSRIPKDYAVVIEGRLSIRNKQRIERGIWIGNGEKGKGIIISQMTDKNRSTLIIRLNHGKKREIRRIFTMLDIRLFSINRFRYHTLELGDLPLGSWRYLSTAEVKELQQ
ncbi:MAG: pseudouridine synthase [Candidatus Neomarinimicrobiota bacterium]